MAKTWKINDSAREMTEKYNQTADEVNTLAKTVIGINEAYVTLKLSEFDLSANSEAEQDGA